MTKISQFFQISQRGSSLGAEIRGGFVTFFAMSYIVILNPIILGGEDSTGGVLDPDGTGRVAAMTALIAGVLTISMGLFANFPIALAAGLGINSIVAISAATLPNATWADIMGLVVIEGLIILVLVLTGFRKAVFNAIPQSLRVAIGVGIGLFVCLIGFVDAGFIVTGSGTPLTIQTGGSLNSIPIVVFVITLFLLIILWVKRVRGAILISIVAMTVISFVIESGLHLGSLTVENPGGWKSSVPSIASDVAHLPDLSLFGHFNLLGSFTNVGLITAVLLVISLLLSDFFDTMGTMLAVANEGEILDEDGNPIRSNRILIVDSIGAALGGMGGVSSNTSYVESTAGVADGARTGLASVVTGILFLLSSFLSPLVQYVPVETAAPALVFVGFLMLSQVNQIDWEDLSVAIPAFLAIVIMPFAYSISAGIGAAFIAYVIIKAAQGKASEVHPLLWGSAVLFVLYFAQTPISALLAGF
jgi:AGZA family xanthine/uracil permease-like MFS transporter